MNVFQFFHDARRDYQLAEFVKLRRGFFPAAAGLLQELSRRRAQCLGLSYAWLAPGRDPLAGCLAFLSGNAGQQEYRCFRYVAERIDGLTRGKSSMS